MSSTHVLPANDCFSAVLIDSYGDGQQYGTGTNPNGGFGIQITDANGEVFNWDAGSGWSQVTRDAAASTSGATSIQEDLSNSLKIYPNPVNQIANINFNANNSTQTTLEVLNSIGQVVKFNNYGILDGEQNLTVNMNDLPSGYYFVNIKTGNKLYNSRITVNN